MKNIIGLLKFNIILLILMIGYIPKIYSQQQKEKSEFDEKEIKIDLSAYLETYIASDNDWSVDQIRQFTIIGSAKKEFAINNAQISSSINYKNIRSKITLHAGTMRESGWEGYTSYPIIQEGYAGVELFKDFWVDAGYFITHIGGEALLSKDNPLSFHAIMSFYEPFYQSGIRFSYKFSDKVKADLHVLNGFGIFDDNNSQKSLGWSLTYEPNEKFNLYYSGILGNEQPSGKEHAFRNFHNIAFSAKPIKFIEAMLQFDYATEENTKDNNDGTFSDAKFFASLLTVKMKFNDKFSVTGRGEVFEDEDGLMGGGYNAKGLTLGFEYKPTTNSFFRIEGRKITLDNQFKLFTDEFQKPTSSREEIMVGFGMWID